MFPGKVVMRGWSRTWVKFALMVGYKTWLDGALAKLCIRKVSMQLLRYNEEFLRQEAIPARINVEHRTERDGDVQRHDGDVGKVRARGVPELELPVDDVDLFASDIGVASGRASLHCGSSGAGAGKEKGGEDRGH